MQLSRYNEMAEYIKNFLVTDTTINGNSDESLLQKKLSKASLRQRIAYSNAVCKLTKRLLEILGED